MSQYITIEKQENDVRFADGVPFEVGQVRDLGVGKITLRQTDDGLFLTRFTGKGNHQFTTALDRDGRWLVGPYNCRWQKPWQEEVDPLLRVMRRYEIPLSHLHRMGVGQGLKVTEESLGDRSWSDDEWGNSFVTDGAKVLSAVGNSRTKAGLISGATFAVEAKVRGGHCVHTYVGQIYVWPGCDPEKIADEIAEIKFGDLADRNFLDAMEDSDVAQQWVAEKYSISAHPVYGDRVLVQHPEWEEPISLVKRWGGEEADTPLRLLVEKHGAELLTPYFGDEQRAFVAAYGDINEAAKYTLARYRVVAVMCGEEKHLKFAWAEMPEQFANLDMPPVIQQDGWWSFSPLGDLLRQHPKLRQLLFVLAKEKDELVPSYDQRHHELRLVDGVWHDEEEPICLESEAVKVWLEARPVGTSEEVMAGAVTCLSCPPSKREGFELKDIQPQDGLRLVAFLRDGDRALVGNSSNVLLFIRPGETKHFVFRLAHFFGQGDCSVWGVTVTRAADGALTFSPYDNEQTYVCSGSMGGEVRHIDPAV